MIRTLAIACALACVAAPAMAQQQSVERCGVFQITDAEHVSYIPIPGYSILLATPPFTAPPGSVHAVGCDRTSIFIGPNDHRVITDLGVPFFIRSGGRGVVVKPGKTFKVIAKNDLAERSLASYGVVENDLLIRSEQHLWRVGTK